MLVTPQRCLQCLSLSSVAISNRVLVLSNWLKRALIVLLLSLFSLCVAAPSVMAEELPVEAEVSPGRSSLDADAISSEKISQFVQAYVQVVDLMEQRENELQGAETESESLQAEQAIEAEALALIQATGLTLQEYLQLLGLANIDPEFGERVAAQLQEATH
jgi:hypothetical protein